MPQEEERRNERTALKQLSHEAEKGAQGGFSTDPAPDYAYERWWLWSGKDPGLFGSIEVSSIIIIISIWYGLAPRVTFWQ